MRFTPLTDPDAARWISPARSFELGTVGSLVPGHFEQYIALPHPIHAYATGLLTWREVAEAARVEVAAVRNPSDLLDHVPDEFMSRLRFDARDVDLAGPDPGNLPLAVVRQLVHVLGPDDLQTSTIFAIWDGWGARTPDMQLGTHLSRGNRGWHLMHAPLVMATVGFTEGPFSHGLGPGMWWPRDASWIVVTDVDLIASYVGCSSRHADALMASDIECFDVHPASTILG